MFSSVIRKKSENRNKNLLNTMQHFYYYKYMYKWPNIPPLSHKKKSCKYFDYSLHYI